MEKRIQPPSPYWLVIAFLLLVIVVQSGALAFLLLQRDAPPESARPAAFDAGPAPWTLEPAPEPPPSDGSGEKQTEESTAENEAAPDSGGTAETDKPALMPVSAEAAEEPEQPPEPSDAQSAVQKAPAEPKSEEAGARLQYEQAAVLPDGLNLSVRDFTVQAIGQVTGLGVSGGSGEYQWFSEDPKIAAVDNEGRITSVSNGTVRVVVTDGQVKGICVVRVKAPSEKYRLSETDFTFRVDDEPVQLKLFGGDEYPGLEWTTSDPDVAMVDENGLVTAVAPGMAVVTATWEGHSRQCFVHVAKSADRNQ